MKFLAKYWLTKDYSNYNFNGQNNLIKNLNENLQVSFQDSKIPKIIVFQYSPLSPACILPKKRE